MRHEGLAIETAYRALFKAHLDEPVVTEIHQATNGNYVLGSPRFQDEIAAMLKRRVTPGKTGRPARTKDGTLRQMDLLQ